jgi:hypothetical protein
VLAPYPGQQSVRDYAPAMRRCFTPLFEVAAPPALDNASRRRVKGHTG